MECCQLPEPKPARPDRCRRCGAQGRRVARETMEHLLRPEAATQIRQGDYYFDRSPECEVVYFSNTLDSYFTKEHMSVRVGLKETEPPIPICYCFGHTKESAREELLTTGRSTVAELITAEVQAGRCSCEVKNPSGKCCLGDVRLAIQEIQEELERRAIVPTKQPSSP